ncbi:glycosyltransferase family 2 protein [Lutibacter profundi]|nr:glycosyltransferase family 2 protein [Lutibacter profundi]
MKQPLVSITMSVYNVEQYLRSSLDCIVNQTLKNIEIICIDDGSTDSSLEILNQYAQNDARIKVTAKPNNEGLAVARNEALALATGKYVTFVDGDDLFDVTMLEKAYQLAESEDADMVLWDYITFWNPTEIQIKKQVPSTLLNIAETNKIALLQRPAFTWIKLIKTAVAKEINISFPKGLTRQDIPVHWQLITQLNAIALLPERLSYYRQQLQATTHKADERLFDLATVMDKTKAYLEQHKIYQTYKEEFLRQQLNVLAGMYDKVPTKLKPKALELIKERLHADQLNYIESNKPLRWQSKLFYKTLKGDILAKMKQNCWLAIRSVYRFFKQ